MSKPRILSLRTTAVQGRFGASLDLPGVELSIIHPVFLYTIIARKGQGKAVAGALKGLRSIRVMWAGPDQYYVQSEANPVKVLREKLTGKASLIDQSHGRVVIRISGPQARAVLAKGTPVDLHPDQFGVGKSALTTMAHVSVHLTRIGDEDYLLSVFRGFSEHFWDWLTISAAEFGYEIA